MFPPVMVVISSMLRDCLQIVVLVVLTVIVVVMEVMMVMVVEIEVFFMVLVVVLVGMLKYCSMDLKHTICK